MATISISIPTDHAGEFRQLWKELRLADALDLQNDLGDPIEVGNFDGANLVQWVVELKPILVPLVTASLTYLITSRGEFEYEKDGEKVRFKNLKPSQVKEILALLDARDKH
ncbi:MULTISPECIES: hypothetical protein [unclassified Mesorhizobium]|uniref:hypothetical protein n=1 Tax=unclassified Mesorhizobium TaxID=325217 RepID=UPI003334B12F